MLPFCDYIEFNESYILNKVMHMNVNNKLQAYNTIMRFLEAYFKLRDLDAVLKCVSEDVYSVGTGTDEAVFGKQQFANLLNREFLQIPNSIEYILDGFKEIFCSFAILIDTVSKFPKKEQQHNSLPQTPFPPIFFTSSLTPICLNSILALYFEAKDLTNSLKSTLSSATK